MTRLANGTNQPPAAQAGDQLMPCSPSAGRLRNARCIHIGTVMALPITPAPYARMAKRAAMASATRAAEPVPAASAARSNAWASRTRPKPNEASATSATAAAARPSTGAYGRAQAGPGTVTAIHCSPFQYQRPSGEYWPAGADGRGVADWYGSGGGW